MLRLLDRWRAAALSLVFGVLATLLALPVLAVLASWL